MSLPTCPTCIYAQGICEKTGVQIRNSTGCTYHKPKRMTNADRIRAMTDEELADRIMGYIRCEACEREFHIECNPLMTCRGVWLEWLKQEIE